MGAAAEKEFLPRPGSRLSKKDAQVIGSTIERLAHEGRDTPQDIVDEARPEGSLMHRYFEWDDSIAGERYRVAQAGELKRAITIVVLPRTEMENPEPIRAFYSVPGEERHHIVPIDSLTDDQAREVIDSMWRDLQAFQKRYNRFRLLFPAVSQELGGVADAIAAAKPRVNTPKAQTKARKKQEAATRAG